MFLYVNPDCQADAYYVSEVEIEWLMATKNYASSLCRFLIALSSIDLGVAETVEH